MHGKQDRTGEIVARHHRREAALLPILNDVRAEFGCVDAEAGALVIGGPDLSRADVHGVVGSPQDCLSAPDPRPEVQICRARPPTGGLECLAADPTFATGERVRIATVHCLGSAGLAARTRAAAASPFPTGLCETKRHGTPCALGGFTPFAVMSAVRHWPEDFASDRRSSKQALEGVAGRAARHPHMQAPLVLRGFL